MLENCLGGDTHAPLYVLRLWGHCQNRKGHIFHNVSEDSIKAICHFKGGATIITNGLEQAGFIVREGDKVTVHQWDEYNSTLVANWKNGPKGGRPAKSKTNQSGTSEKPVANQSITSQEPIREEKIREDKKTEAQASPVAFPPVLDTTEFRQAWEDWTAYRKERKIAALKPRSVSAQLAKLQMWGHAGAIESIRQSIAQNYQGLFEPKEITTKAERKAGWL